MEPEKGFLVRPEHASVLNFMKRPANVSQNAFPKTKDFFCAENLKCIDASLKHWERVAQNLALNVLMQQNALTETTETTQTLTNLADTLIANVMKQTDKVAEIKKDSPSLENPRNDFEGIVTLVQQITYRSIFCNQIIREVIRFSIAAKIAEAKLIPNSKNTIKLYKPYLNGMIPHEIALKPIASIEQIFQDTMLLLMEFEAVVKSGREITAKDIAVKCG